MRAAHVVLCLAALFACKKEYDAKPGGRCPGQWWTARKGVCADKSTFLVCDMSMTFTAIPCRGPKGCSGTEPGAFADQCDISGNADGDVCPKSGSFFAADSDRTCSGAQMVVCTSTEKSVIEHLPCRGPKGCSGAGRALKCDDSIAEAGDKCDTVVYQALYTCSTDKKTLLACRGS